MSIRVRKVLPLAICGCWFTCTLAFTETLPSVEEILGKSVERARWYRTELIEERFESRLIRVSDKLGGDGAVEESETLEYEIEPLHEYPGYTFDRLVRKNGQSLSEDEVIEEEERKEKLLGELAKGNEQKSAEDKRVEYDERLLGRYEFELVGLNRDGNRPAYVIAFQPKSGNLPVRKRIDRALNKAEGEIWVDVKTFEVARVAFRLTDKVNIGWGILGSIGELSGEINRRPVDGDIWMPDEIQFFLNGRVFFSNLHRRETLNWSNFRLVLKDLRRNSVEAMQTASP
jgi:hypothetical protein